MQRTVNKSQRMYWNHLFQLLLENIRTGIVPLYNEQMHALGGPLKAIPHIENLIPMHQVLESFSTRFSSCAVINAFPGFATSSATGSGFICWFLPTIFPSSTVDPDASTAFHSCHLATSVTGYSHHLLDYPIWPNLSGYTKTPTATLKRPSYGLSV